jgi:hypothetical protein
MTMWEEIEAIFDKIDEWHREFQLRFSQPFFYSLIQKLPKINRSSRALAANQPHTVAPTILLHRWILHCITIISN